MAPRKTPLPGQSRFSVSGSYQHDTPTSSTADPANFSPFQAASPAIFRVGSSRAVPKPRSNRSSPWASQPLDFSLPPQTPVPTPPPAAFTFETPIPSHLTSLRPSLQSESHDIPPACDRSSPIEIDGIDSFLGPDESESDPRDVLFSSPALVFVPRKRAVAMTMDERREHVLEVMREVGLKPAELLIDVLTPEYAQYEHWRNGFYSGNSSRLEQLLDVIWWHPTGKERFQKWMKPHAVELVCGEIATEMVVTRHLYEMKTANATPEFLESWKPFENSESGPKPIGHAQMPVWMRVLDAATSTKSSLDNKRRHPSSVMSRLLLSFIVDLCTHRHRASSPHKFITSAHSFHADHKYPWAYFPGPRVHHVK